MDAVRRATKVRDQISDYLVRIDADTTLLADMLANLPGHIQYRLWRLMKALIARWVIKAQLQTYDPQYTEMFMWAERVDRDTNK